MKLQTLIATAATLMLAGTVSTAAAPALTDAYLYGTWSLDGAQACGSPQARYVLFRANGTVEVGKGSLVTRVGFWKIINGNTIIGHTLTAPMHHEEYHPFFRDTYRYEYMSPQVTETTTDSFSVMVGSDLEKEAFTLTRCPAP